MILRENVRDFPISFRKRVYYCQLVWFSLFGRFRRGQFSADQYRAGGYLCAHGCAMLTPQTHPQLNTRSRQQAWFPRGRCKLCWEMRSSKIHGRFAQDNFPPNHWCLSIIYHSTCMFFKNISPISNTTLYCKNIVLFSFANLYFAPMLRAPPDHPLTRIFYSHLSHRHFNLWLNIFPRQYCIVR